MACAGDALVEETAGSGRISLGHFFFDAYLCIVKKQKDEKVSDMKKVSLFLVALLVMVSSAAMAQKTLVKGLLKDNTSGEGEPFATVRIFKEGKADKPVAMFLTDAEGRFSQELTGQGPHRIVFSSMGKEELKRDIELGKVAVLDLETLYIKENSTALKGVEVVAQKPLVKMEVDKMSYNVAEDEDAKAATVLDMLRKVPMVTVDGQDNISVNGSSAFKVYVDGKPNVMFSTNPSMIFKSMPASVVKNIEVMTNPGAKYDAEGASGVLNIVMNRQDPVAMQSMNGYNGSLRAAAGNRGMGAGAFLSGQQGKLSYSANAMVNYSKPGASELEMQQKNGSTDITTTSSTKMKIPFTMGSLSLGYDLDPMSSVSLTASVQSFSMKNNGRMNTLMLGAAASTGFGYGYQLDQKSSRTGFSGSADYQHFFNQERTSSIVLTYQLDYAPTRTKAWNDFDQTSTSFVDLTDRYSDSKETSVDHILQTDYTTPLGTGQTLALGGKLQLRNASSDSKYYLEEVYTPQMSSDYHYKNSILAGYAEYSGNWGSLGAKAGLRYEHTWQDVEYRLGNGSDFTTDYGSLVPTANLSYSLSPTSNIGLAYNMRISRPGISYLNPYVDRSNPNALSYGNSALDVEKAHNLSLVYNLFTSKLMLNLNIHHNFTDNAISQYSFYDGSLMNTTYGNIVKRHQTGMNAYVNWLVAPKTRLFMNGSVNYTDMRSNELDASSSGWTTNLMGGLQQTLPWDLKLSAYLITSSKTYTLQGWSSGFNMCTASLSKSLLKDKLTLSLSAMAGLNDGGNLKMESYSSGTGFDSHQDMEIPMSGVTFNVTYTFGNSKRQQRQRVSRVQNDYIEQQSQGEMLNSVGNGGAGNAGGGQMGGM